MKIVPNVTRAAVDQSRHTTTYPRQAPGTSGRSSNITAEEVLISCPANKQRTVLLRGGSARHSVVVRTLRLSCATRSRSLKSTIVSHIRTLKDAKRKHRLQQVYATKDNSGNHVTAPAEL